jgi:hypothetical protein
MTFRELREFIDDSLQEPPVDGGGERPRSKQEFLGLLDVLRGKSDAMDLLPILEQRTSLLDQQKALKGNLVAARDNTRRTSKKSKRNAKGARVRELEGKLKHLEWDLAKVHAKLQGKRFQQQLQRLKILGRIQRDIECVFKYGSIVPTSRLPWRVLPPGELSVGAVLEHYGRLQRRNPHIRYERERIKKAFSLQPDRCYVGQDEFEGYIVLTFAHTPRALLECPVFGNAIYIIDSDWKRWSRMSKRELLHRANGVTRIIHKGDWFWRVKGELGIR